MKFEFESQRMSIEIKAKSIYSDRASKYDTCVFLNTLALFSTEASERYYGLGLYALAASAKSCAEEIHDQLNELGFYKESA